MGGIFYQNNKNMSQELFNFYYTFRDKFITQIKEKKMIKDKDFYEYKLVHNSETSTFYYEFNKQYVLNYENYNSKNKKIDFSCILINLNSHNNVPYFCIYGKDFKTICKLINYHLVKNSMLVNDYNQFKKSYYTSKVIDALNNIKEN